MKRVAVPAAAATVVLFCAMVALWLGFVRYVARATAEQGRVASDLLAQGVRLTPALASTLQRPGLRIVITDPDAGLLIDAGSGGIATHAIPPRDGNAFPGPPGVPAPGAPPGLTDIAPGEPLPFPPPGGMPPDRAHPLLPRPVAQFALALAHVAPFRAERGGRTIEIAPDGGALGAALAYDVLVFATGVCIVGGAAGSRAVVLARAERRDLEARIAERRAAAERYQRFLADTGHELRTPLTVMTGYVDILRTHPREGPLDGRIVEGMYAETARMRILVEKMLTLARLESDAGVPRLLDVGTAARDATLTAQRRYPERDVRVAAGPPASIVIDADDYAAAVGNLLENAVKYAPGSPIAVETNVRDGSAVTSVVDHGPGIAANQQKAIFERFYRGNDRAFGDGLGLGLAIVSRIAERWNGRVDCESGGGTTVFRLTFPLADEEAYGAR